jgi:hypothetical protein
MGCEEYECMEHQWDGLGPSAACVLCKVAKGDYYDSLSEPLPPSGVFAIVLAEEH